MSKRIARQRKRKTEKPRPHSKRRPVVIICSLLLLTFAVGVMAQWKILPGSTKPLLLASAPTGSFAAQSPSKEYIYAGNRLIATEDPASAPQRTNVALADNGGAATSPPSLGSGFPATAVNNGDRKGLNWGSGGGWADGTVNSFPDSLEIDFNSNKTINEIDIFGVQDDYQNPIEPTETMTFSSYGLTDFDVQYWDGANWVNVPGGSITGNDKIWRKLTFTDITTSKIRIVVNNAPNGYSRIVEVEAWGN